MAETAKVICVHCGKQTPAEQVEEKVSPRAKAEEPQAMPADELRNRLPTALPVGGIITPV